MMAGAMVSHHYFGKNVLIRHGSNYSITLQGNPLEFKNGKQITLGALPLVRTNTCVLTRKEYEYIKNLLPQELYTHKSFKDEHIHKYYHKYRPYTYRRVLQYLKKLKKEGN